MSDAARFPAEIAVAPPPFTMERVVRYGEITADMNPLHTDASFAATTRFGRPIVHGLLVMAPLWAAIERAFGGEALAGMESDLRFVAPTFVGTTPRYVVALEGVAAGQARYRIEVVDADGGVAVTGTLTLPSERG